MKAKELGISLKTPPELVEKRQGLVFLSCPRGSWPGNQMLTKRDKWVLKNIPSTKVPCPLMSRNPCETCPVTHLLTPRPPRHIYPHDSGNPNILEDMEVGSSGGAGLNPP
ncbi:hypothetical protein GWK47_004173 [Chionoecetes opilio]|uniref:Uncharacterized protein n=1 Tax=Chionoecetes opilio TaxID=41210 RepID=A0A8J4YF56_CHIOP|nr:hypothetical protein GWK47_004173 [Chionoecetes opilio]